MSTIHLKNIRIFANHGCLVEEEKIGSDYLVNLTVEANLEKASQTDALEDTVDYVRLNAIVKEQMAIRSKLLEHVVKRIISSIFEELSMVEKVRVCVAKVNPPIDGDVQEVSIALEEKKP